MVRVSKVPYESYQFNAKRAAALARLDGYLEDIFSGRVKDIFGGFTEFPNEMLKIIGIGDILTEEMNEMMKRVKARAEPIIANQDQAEMRKKLEEKILPDVKRLAQIVEDFGLVAGRTLPEQALVLGASAFEVYLKDITANIVANNSKIASKFREEIKNGLTLARLDAYRNDVKRTKGEIAAETVQLEPNRIRLILKRLIGWNEIFVSKDAERRFVRIIAIRNLIIHRAGQVDTKFKRITKHPGPVDQALEINRAYSLESLTFLTELVELVESNLHPKTNSLLR